MNDSSKHTYPPKIHIEVSGPVPEDVANILLRIEHMLTKEFKGRPETVRRTIIHREVSPTVQAAVRGATYPTDDIVDLRNYDVTIVGRLRE